MVRLSVSVQRCVETDSHLISHGMDFIMKIKDQLYFLRVVVLVLSGSIVLIVDRPTVMGEISMRGFTHRTVSPKR